MKNMKKFLAIALTLITLFSVVSFAVQAADEEVTTFITGGAEYKIIDKSTVSFELCYSCPDEILNIPSHVTYDGKTYRVTEINGCVSTDPELSVDIREISIPYTVEYISNGIVYSGAEVITVHKNNKHYYVDSFGVLYSYDKHLVMFPAKPATSYEIKEGTVSLGYFAFHCAYSLGDSAFTAVYIPASVTFIGNNCFGLTALRKVFYGGTKEQWENIDKSLVNEKLDRVQIVYNATGCVDTETCDCKCHASWFEAIFFKLFNAIAMFFGFGEPVCKCGTQH